MAMRLHIENAEPICVDCQHGERMRALELERRAPVPAARPWSNLAGPTAGYAQIERERLLWALADDDTETRRTA